MIYRFYDPEEIGRRAKDPEFMREYRTLWKGSPAMPLKDYMDMKDEAHYLRIHPDGTRETYREGNQRFDGKLVGKETDTHPYFRGAAGEYQMDCDIDAKEFNKPLPANYPILDDNEEVIEVNNPAEFARLVSEGECYDEYDVLDALYIQESCSLRDIPLFKIAKMIKAHIELLEKRKLLR